MAREQGRQDPSLLPVSSLLHLRKRRGNWISRADLMTGRERGREKTLTTGDPRSVRAMSCKRERERGKGDAHLMPCHVCHVCSASPSLFHSGRSGARTRERERERGFQRAHRLPPVERLQRDYHGCCTDARGGERMSERERERQEGRKEGSAN